MACSWCRHFQDPTPPTHERYGGRGSGSWYWEAFGNCLLSPQAVRKRPRDICSQFSFNETVGLDGCSTLYSLWEFTRTQREELNALKAKNIKLQKKLSAAKQAS